MVFDETVGLAGAILRLGHRVALVEIEIQGRLICRLPTAAATTILLLPVGLTEHNRHIFGLYHGVSAIVAIDECVLVLTSRQLVMHAREPTSLRLERLLVFTLRRHVEREAAAVCIVPHRVHHDQLISSSFSPSLVH